MFSDFQNHNLGVPQIAPVFGIGKGNVIFDGPGENEDFGREQITGDPADRYKFRTSPLRNAALQPAFFHNGSFSRLEDAIRHHLNAFDSALAYNPMRAGVAEDLCLRMGPIGTALAEVDPLLASPIDLRPDEFQHLVAFVREALLDVRLAAKLLCSVIPTSVPAAGPC